MLTVGLLQKPVVLLLTVLRRAAVAHIRAGEAGSLAILLASARLGRKPGRT